MEALFLYRNQGHRINVLPPKRKPLAEFYEKNVPYACGWGWGFLEDLQPQDTRQMHNANE
jgi:hypothetical protein